MTVIHYTPGAWRAVVAPQGVALLPEGVGAEMLDRIWHALAAGHGLGAVLESLTGAFGTSLRSIPPFAVATVERREDGDGDSAGAGGNRPAEVRLAVRGPLVAVVTEAGGASTGGSSHSYEVSGADVTTWSERVAPAATALVLRAVDTVSGRAEAPGGDRFGIANGIVLCSSLELELELGAPGTGAAASGSSAAAAAASEPVDDTTIGADDVAAHGVDAGAVDSSTAETPPAPVPAPRREPVPAPAPPHSGEPSAAEGDDTDRDAVRDDVESTRSELPDDAYDHLWGATVVKSVEDAAVRELDDEDETAAPSAAAPTPSPSPTQTPTTAQDAASPDSPFAPPSGGERAVGSPPGGAPVAPSGLIDSLPDFGAVGAVSSSERFDARTVPPTATPGIAPAPVPGAQRPTAPPSAPPASPGESAAASAASGEPAASAAATAQDDDHDGLTVTVSELEAMRRLEAASDTPAAAPPAGSLGRIVLSTGETHQLDRTVVIGRRPRANRVQVDAVPLLVTVPSPEQDISRNHLEVRLEGRHVLVVDLATTNGSVLHRAGTPPLRLAPDEPVLVLDRDVVDLGDGVTVLFEEIP